MMSEQEALGNVAPSLETRDAGTIKALYSTTNGGTVSVIQDGKEKPSATSTRKVKIKYTAKDCTTGGTTPISKCNLDGVAANDPFKYSDIKISGIYNWGFKINDETLRKLCENRTEFYNTIIKNKLDAAIQGLNAEYLKQAILKMGKYPLTGVESLVTPKQIPVITSAGVANPAGLALIKSIYQQMNRSEKPIIVGAGKLDVLANALGYSGLASNGINGAAAELSNYFRDANVNSTGQFEGDGTDNILTWIPGALRPVEFYQNAGDHFEYGSEISVGGKKYFSYEYGRAELGGIVWDFFMKRNCDEWQFAFQKEFEVFSLPSDAFGACQDYNYALAFQLACGDLTCELINDSVTPPAA